VTSRSLIIWQIFIYAEDLSTALAYAQKSSRDKCCHRAPLFWITHGLDINLKWPAMKMDSFRSVRPNAINSNDPAIRLSYCYTIALNLSCTEAKEELQQALHQALFLVNAVTQEKNIISTI